MRISDLLRRPLGEHLRTMSWSDLTNLATAGDIDALAAMASARPGLGWYLVSLARATGIEDCDAVVMEALWRAVTAQRPDPEAMYGTMRSHIMTSARQARRWRDCSSAADISALVDRHRTGGSADPTGDQVLTSLALAAVPVDVVRAASRKAMTATPLTPADRQRLHRWRASSLAQLTPSAA